MLERINSNPNDFAARYKNMLENPEFNIFYNAPALVIILGDTRIKNYMTDCSLAASYFMFAAAAKSLGTCWINFALSMSDSIKENIGVPADYKIVAPLVVGYPAVIPEIPKRSEPKIIIAE
jgi:nitroreductase